MLNHNIIVAHLIKFFNGIALSPILVAGYFITIGTEFHFGQDTFYIVFCASAFGCLCQYILEVANGYRADLFGEKLTLAYASIFRIFHFLILFCALSLPSPSPTLFLSLILISNIIYALSYTLLSGNFEDWLQKQCSQNSLNIFAINNACLFFGLMVGLGMSLIWLPKFDYTSMYSGAMAVYIIACSASIISLVFVFMMKNTKPFKVNHFWEYILSLFQFDSVKRKKTKQDIALVKNELSAQPQLNRIFWVQSIFYSVDLVLEVLIAVYILVSHNFNIQQKSILLILCYLLPHVLGSFVLSKKEENNELQKVKLLYKDTLLFFSITILMAMISVFPFAKTIWYLDPVFIAFGIVIIWHQLQSGRLFPHYYDYCSALAQKHSELPKTLLSIGERRKKIGAVLSLLISASASVFEFKEAYFWVVAALSILGIFYSTYVFRDIISYFTVQKTNAAKEKEMS